MRPHLEYGSTSFFLPYTLDKVQNQALRLITGAWNEKNNSTYQSNERNDQQQMQSGTDSRSALDALYNQSEPHLSRTLHSILEERRVVLQWIPAHCVINGNEMADKLAKKGAAMTQHDNPITLAGKKTIIKHCFKTRKIPDNYHKLDRAGQVIILRLRTGHNRLNSPTMYLSNRKPDCGPYTPGLPNLHQPEDPDMA